MRSIGWQDLVYKNSKLFIKKLPLLPFYVGKVLRSHDDLNRDELVALRKKYNLLTFSYEPFSLENFNRGRAYFKIPKQSLQLTPTKTLWLDLTKTEGQLEKELSQKTRYNLKHAKNELGCEILSGKKFTAETIREIMHVWSKNRPYSLLFPAPKHEFLTLLKSFAKAALLSAVLKSVNPSKPWHFA
jgi:hypothetical protein